MFWILLVLLGITQLHALPKTLTPGACTKKTLPTPSDKNIIQEFLESDNGNGNGGWAYEYSSVKDKEEGLSSASMAISKTKDLKKGQEESYTLLTQYQIKGQKFDPPINDVVEKKNNKLVSTTEGPNGKPETEYVILKFKKQAYVYFYKCSNEPGAENGKDARFVLAWNGELSKENKKEVEDFDRSLSEGAHKVFTNHIQEI